MKAVILGGGIAGLGAAYRLRECGIDAVIYEAAPQIGGLCASFPVGDFRFDTFGHISFDQSTRPWLEDVTPHGTRPSQALNYDAGRWLKHPVQSHLSGLPLEERIEIIVSFTERQRSGPPRDYGMWLRQTYGDVFAERYPYRYTRKYWTVEPEALESRWVSGRMAEPALSEVLRGAMDDTLEGSHYSQLAHYPLRDGFQAFLHHLAKGAAVRTGKRVVAVNPKTRQLRFADGESADYDALISSIPLPELCRALPELPEAVRQAAGQLYATSGVTVSVGLSRKEAAPSGWLYVYDTDILPARINAPSFFSADNAPPGCCSLQAEIYYSAFSPRRESLQELERRCLRDMIRMGLFAERDIVVTDTREHPYANIIFTEEIYRSRETVLRYLDTLGIVCAGRFGQWDYLWVGQSLKSGMAAAERVSRKTGGG